MAAFLRVAVLLKRLDPQPKLEKRVGPEPLMLGRGWDTTSRTAWPADWPRGLAEQPVSGPQTRRLLEQMLLLQVAGVSQSRAACIQVTWSLVGQGRSVPRSRRRQAGSEAAAEPTQTGRRPPLDELG